jgi:hypothetical protein
MSFFILKHRACIYIWDGTSNFSLTAANLHGGINIDINEEFQVWNYQNKQFYY